MRQSFWLTSRLVPSLTTSAESPPGPSVIDVSTWIATVQSAAEVGARRRRWCGSGCRSRAPAAAGRARGSGSRARARRCRGARCARRPATPRRSGRRGGARRRGSRRLDPVVEVVAEAGRCAGRRTTTRRTRARTTGRRRSSRRPVSMRMPAWPSDVARIDQRRVAVGGTHGPAAHRFRRRAGRCTAGRPASTCSVHAVPSQ